MPLPDSLPPPAGTDPVCVPAPLADQWAAVSKAMAIYPDTNQRVSTAVDEFAAALQATTRAQGSVHILFSLDAVCVGPAVAELPERGQLRWLQERLHAVGLAGARFDADVGPAAIRGFTRRLLDHHAALAMGRVPRWDAGEQPAGLAPIERRFAGRFGPEGVEGGESVAAWGGGQGPQAGVVAQESSGGAASDAPSAAQVLPAFATDPAVLARLRALSQGEGTPSAGEDPSSLLDLLHRAVELLPADVRADPIEARTLLIKILTDVRATAGPVAAARGDSTLKLEEALHDVSHRLLARPADAPVAAVATPTTSRTSADPAPLAESEACVDVLARVAKLPSAVAPEQVLARLHDAGETLGALLHCASGEPSGRAVERCAEFITEQAALSPVLKAVLAAYLDPASATVEASPGEPPAAPVLDDHLHRLLRTPEAMRFARASGWLAVPQVHATFPARLGMALETLDERHAPDLEEMGALLGGLSDAQVRSARDVLLGEQQLGSENRLPRLLRAASPHVLRAARIALLLGTPALRSASVECIRRFTRDRDDACLLRLVPRAEALPDAYLLALTRDPPVGNEKVEHHRRISEALCQLVTQAHAGSLAASVGVEAVVQMARFPGSGLVPTLRAVARSRWYLWNRAPALLRRAAAQVLYTFENRR